MRPGAMYETPLVSFVGEDSDRKMPLVWDSPATEKSETALIKHLEEHRVPQPLNQYLSLKKHADSEFTISNTT
jgi:hypothetical protein